MMLRMDVLPLPDLPISSTYKAGTNGGRTNRWVPSGAAEQSRSERFARQRRTAAAFALHFARTLLLDCDRVQPSELGIAVRERAAIGLVVHLTFFFIPRCCVDMAAAPEEGAKGRSEGAFAATSPIDRRV